MIQGIRTLQDLYLSKLDDPGTLNPVTSCNVPDNITWAAVIRSRIEPREPKLPNLRTRETMMLQ